MKTIRKHFKVAYITDAWTQHALANGFRGAENNSSKVVGLFEGFKRMAKVTVFSFSDFRWNKENESMDHEFKELDPTKFDLCFVPQIHTIEQWSGGFLEKINAFKDKGGTWGIFCDGYHWDNFRLDQVVYPHFDFIATDHIQVARRYNDRFQECWNRKGVAVPVGYGVEDRGSLSKEDPYPEWVTHPRLFYAGIMHPQDAGYLTKLLDLFPEATLILAALNVSADDKGYLKTWAEEKFPERTIWLSDFIGNKWNSLGPCAYGIFRNYITYADLGLAYPHPERTVKNSKIYTYWEAGLPVLCHSGNVSAHEIVPPLGGIADWNDLDSLKQGVMDCFDFPRDRFAIRETCLSRYDWRMIGERILLSLYPKELS